MKVLHLLRHAKSSWAEPGLTDFERPLNARGRQAAALMAAHITATGLRPALVLCSAAVRTRETHAAIAASLPGVPVEFEQGLYETTRAVVYDRLTRLPARLPSVLVIGHNPSLERLSQFLMQDEPGNLLAERLLEKYPTGTLTTLEAPVDDWALLPPGGCRLTGFVRPVDLERAGA